MSEKENKKRLPPGQQLLTNPDDFPVLDLGVQPEFNPESYRFEVSGLVQNPIQMSFGELRKTFSKTKMNEDFHCVTRWSKFDVKWGGISYFALEELVKPKDEAKFVLQYGLDGYTTNTSIVNLQKDNVLLAYEMYGQDLPREHGAPLRMIIPHLYAWKGSKFLTKLEFLAEDQKGFWEQRGYSNTAKPWEEDRYG